LATVDLSTVTLGGSNILLGHADTNGGSSADPNDSILNVTLIDNISVTVIPEPSTVALAVCGLVSFFLIRRRK
jgi:hypothetical protein